MSDDATVYQVEKHLLDRLDGMVKINLDLIGHRMGWLLISQSFLFTAMALSAANVGRQPLEDPEGRLAAKILSLLIHVIPVIGLISALLVLVGLAAAVWVIFELKARRAIVEHRLASRGEALGTPLANVYTVSSVHRGNPRDWLGHLPTLIIPVVLLGAWALVLARAFH